MPMLKQLHKKTLLSKKKEKKSHFAQTCIWRNKIGMAAKKTAAASFLVGRQSSLLKEAKKN